MWGEREAGAQAARAGNLERRGMAPEFRPEALAYDATPNPSTCPASKVLTYQGREDRVGVIRPRYPAPARDCRACPFRPSCCPQTSRGGTLVRREKVPGVAAFVADGGGALDLSLARGGRRVHPPRAAAIAGTGLEESAVRGAGGLPDLQHSAGDPPALEDSRGAGGLNNTRKGGRGGPERASRPRQQLNGRGDSMPSP